MNLLERKREEHRSRALQRVGSVLVCISFLLALAFPPQPVKAVVVADDAMIAAVAAAFLSSCGMTFKASGMDSSGVKNQIGAVIDNYLGVVFDGQSPIQWLGEFTLGYGHGKIVLPAGVANKLSAFAEWVKGKFSVETDNVVQVYKQSSASFLLKNGEEFFITPAVFNDKMNMYQSVSFGTILKATNDQQKLIFANDSYIVYFNGVCSAHYSDGRELRSVGINRDASLVLFSDENCDIWFAKVYDDPTSSIYGALTKYFKVTELFSDLLGNGQEFSIVSDVVSIPDTIPDTQEVTISTGAASDLTLDQALEQILAAIAEGQLSATREIVDAGTATDDPAQTITDVDELGLPALAETLTTRFPFSIPWDVAKAVKLLAAPPKTPRFEVDFMAPIAYRFGGQLGNTNIVLDFSDYEIIGQISRWTSTIGFCLFLASGTKKLIWTA